MTADDLLPGVIAVESGGDPGRMGTAGEIGLAQIKPSTAAQYGVSANDLWQPEVNRSVARRYLTELLDKYHGDPVKALSAYNAGPANVDRGFIPASTRQYVGKVFAHLGLPAPVTGMAPPPAVAAAPVKPWARPAANLVASARPVIPRMPSFGAPLATPPTPTPAAPAQPGATPAPASHPHGLLEDRMRLALLDMGFNRRLARLIASAYADVHRLPGAQPRLRATDPHSLVAADVPKLYSLLNGLRGINV